MGVIARHQLRQMLGQRRLALLAVFLLLPVLAALLTRGQGQPLEHALMLYIMYPQAVCVLLSLLYGTSVLSSELESQTLTYLFVRPIPRWHVVVGKYIATTLVLLLGVNVSFAMAWVASSSGAGGDLFASLGLSASLSVVAYTALFTALGVFVPSRAMIVGVLAAMIEFALSIVPAVINTVTISYYLRSLVYGDFKNALPPSQQSDPYGGGNELATALERVIGEATTFQAVGALLIATIVCLAIASYGVRRRVYVEQADV